MNIGYVTWMSTFYHEKYHLSLSTAGFTSMFFHFAAALLGVLIGGKLSDKYGTKAVNSPSGNGTGRIVVRCSVYIFHGIYLEFICKLCYVGFVRLFQGNLRFKLVCCFV